MTVTITTDSRLIGGFRFDPYIYEEQQVIALDKAKQQLLEAYCGSDGKPYCTCETPKSSQLEDPSNEGRVYTVEI